MARRPWPQSPATRVRLVEPPERAGADRDEPGAAVEFARCRVSFANVEDLSLGYEDEPTQRGVEGIETFFRKVPAARVGLSEARSRGPAAASSAYASGS